MDKEHPINRLKNRYPQLMLPIKPDISKSELYQKVVYEGHVIPHGEKDLPFSFSDRDKLTVELFTCGEIPILFLNVRKDFECFLQKTAYRCEPTPIPRSMGAVTINGLYNREKCERDALIVLSKGFYSGLDASATSYSPVEWQNISLQIRKYHELTHFICRRKYRELKNVLLDEVFADCMGLIMATGQYDTCLAKLFLGTEKDAYRAGGRLENYVSEGNRLDEMHRKANRFIHQLSELVAGIEADREEFEAMIDSYYPRAHRIYSMLFLG